MNNDKFIITANGKHFMVWLKDGGLGGGKDYWLAGETHSKTSLPPSATSFLTKKDCLEFALKSLNVEIPTVREVIIVTDSDTVKKSDYSADSDASYNTLRNLLFPSKNSRR
jgi:hypothetical protein